MNLIKTIMSKLAVKRFVPEAEDAERGALPLEQVEILEALKRYKAQNPTKYERKKEALFKRYGFSVEDSVKLEKVLDESDIELEALTKKVAKTK